MPHKHIYDEYGLCFECDHRKDNRGGPREGAGKPRIEARLQKKRAISLSDNYAEGISSTNAKGNLSEGIRFLYDYYKKTEANLDKIETALSTAKRSE